MSARSPGRLGASIETAHDRAHGALVCRNSASKDCCYARSCSLELGAYRRRLPPTIAGIGDHPALPLRPTSTRLVITRPPPLRPVARANAELRIYWMGTPCPPKPTSPSTPP